MLKVRAAPQSGELVKMQQDICKICLIAEEDEVMFGPILKQQGMVVHYFCMLFCHNLAQRGDEKKDMVGFKVKDIEKNLNLIKDNKCCFCDKLNAGSKCKFVNCDRYFHVPCGMKNTVHFNFVDNEITCICISHSPIYSHPNITTHYEDSKKSRECKICFDEMSPKFILTRCIWTPCCNDGFFHYECLMRAGNTQGYYFNCPIADCGDNSDEVLDAYRRLGIHIPKRLALYERDDELKRFSGLERKKDEIMTFDEMSPLDTTVEPCNCDYQNCVGANRGNLGTEIVLCTTCKIHFAHKKCLYYFKGKWDLSNPESMPKNLVFECKTCYSKYCISKI